MLRLAAWYSSHSMPQGGESCLQPTLETSPPAPSKPASASDSPQESLASGSKRTASKNASNTGSNYLSACVDVDVGQSTTSGSIFSSAKYSAKTASCQATNNRSMSNSGPEFRDTGQKIALGCKCSTGKQHMDVRMPMQKFAMRLNRPDHTGHDILAPEHALCFGLETGPRTGREFAKQLAIEPSVQSKTLADRRPSLRSGARGREQAVWYTAQPRKERPIESHGRKSHGTQPIDPLRGGLTEGANSKAYMRICIRAYTCGGPEATSHRLMVVNH